MRKNRTIGILVLGLLLAVTYVAVRVLVGPESAPPYEDIRRSIYRVTGHDIDPSEPEVGLDGIVDPKIREGLGRLQDTLVGKKVNRWKGWTEGSYTEYEFRTYNVSVHMDNPQTGDTYPDVLLIEVSQDQVRELGLVPPGQQVPTPQRQVIFSGIIAGTRSDARVYVRDVRIEQP